jgi:outer membrane protein OmpA-like peptidoglycan-associated protein
VKFLFKPGSTSFWADPQVSGDYQTWLEQIARRTSRSGECLEITGHTSPTGPEPLNERLSLLRAESIQQRLVAQAPALSKRTLVNGVGSRETMIGTGKDDATDALDRRVEFKVLSCAA